MIWRDVLDVLTVGIRRVGPCLFAPMRWLAAPLVFCCATATASVDIDRFTRMDGAQDVAISPTGEYYAATVTREGRTGLVVVRLSDKKQTASIMLDKNSQGRYVQVNKFWWVNSSRLVFTASVNMAARDTTEIGAELHAVDADGERPVTLADRRARTSIVGGSIQMSGLPVLIANVVDDLPEDDANVIVAVPHRHGRTTAEKLNVYTGDLSVITEVPLSGAIFVTDSTGSVRLAYGPDEDGSRKLYFRADANSEWRLINAEAESRRVEVPVGFSADGHLAYLQTEQAEGPDAIVAFDASTGSRTEVLRDRIADPLVLIRAAGANRYLVGATFMSGKPRTDFFDSGSPDAVLHRGLAAAFPDQSVSITSATADGKLLVVSVTSPRNPGDFYLFDVERKKASLLLSRLEWIDPEQLAELRPVELKARDGMNLHAYLTLPKSSEGKDVPMVVISHDGPMGLFHRWGFSNEAQLLARAGYAVLQVNPRGSGNYGRAFEQAGMGQWGSAMQDDLADATRWAISAGIADPDRVCISGSGYGGYAALMGVARDPALYKCAVGRFGVYSLELLVGDSKHQGRSVSKKMPSGVRWYVVRAMLDSAGDQKMLKDISPASAKLASRIKVPVLLVAGKDDEIASDEHGKIMEAALRKHGVPVETILVDGHQLGFNDPQALRTYYASMLEFLGRHLGGERSN